MSKTNHFEALSVIGEAIIKNVCKPRPNEEEKFTTPRWHRASQYYEGDSQNGIVLFIGISNGRNFPVDEVMSFLGVEEAEYYFKLEKFQKKLKKGGRFATKVKLIENYIKFKGLPQGSQQLLAA